MSANTARHIWITGAGSGIGEQLAIKYAQQGHQVVVSGRNVDRLLALKEKSAGSILPMAFDVSDEQQVETASQTLAELVPCLDLVILNAGICEYVDTDRLDPALFRRVMDTNFHGLVNSWNAARELMLKAPGQAHLAGVCSMAGFIGFPRAEAYGASKAAAAYFLHSLRTDLAGRVDVTVINPGFVRTPLTAANDFAMPFLIDADEAADTIINGLARRPLALNFPRRLAFSLRLAQCFSGLWYRRIVPGMQRKRNRERTE